MKLISRPCDLLNKEHNGDMGKLTQMLVYPESKIAAKRKSSGSDVGPSIVTSQNGNEIVAFCCTECKDRHNEEQGYFIGKYLFCWIFKFTIRLGNGLLEVVSKVRKILDPML